MIRPIQGTFPRLAPNCFVHEAAEVIGLVEIGAETSVWPGAVVRGDTERIRIGGGSNVQDGAVIHADPGYPCVVGQQVTVGHQACLHGCTIDDGSLIGIGAIVLNGAIVGSGSIIGAGAMVPEGAEIPAGVLALGVPAKIRRETTEAERAGLIEQAARYVGMIDIHRGGEGRV
ncbi:MAG: gamma carbonic anhydrase family protein [Thermoleophilia bacterium]|nr:gamma carbonic anhydrase family protein [Thermoleophilia bacterium]MDH3725045.1 gamma carbonic anhydrase family protein [Thermoleophilia bacterium]